MLLNKKIKFKTYRCIQVTTDFGVICNKALPLNLASDASPVCQEENTRVKVATPCFSILSYPCAETRCMLGILSMDQASSDIPFCRAA